MKQILSILTAVLAVILLSLQGVQAQDEWTLKNPNPKPVAIFVHAMASLGGDQVLFFGGNDDVPHYAHHDETWVYDLSDNTWILKSPASKPSARSTHAMASLGGDQVLLFGGNDGSVLNDETWVYDLSDNTWTLMSPATKPSARYGHKMASLGDDQVLLFSGSSLASTNDETWVYDLSDNTWTLKSPATTPLARSGHAMANISGGQVLLFGGVVGGPTPETDETWVYDLSDNTWTMKTPVTKPFGRNGHEMASLGGDQVLLFGGYSYLYSSHNDEAWIYDLSDNTWTLKSPAAKPSARRQHSMASLGADQVLLFGGYDAVVDDETWVYTTDASPPSPPDAPILASPADGATDISLNPTLSWDASSGADSYTLQVSDFSDFSNLVVSQSGISTTSYDISGLANSTTYYWQVNATNAGGTSEWSDSWSFSTIAPAQAQDDWTLKSPATEPSARTGHAVASLGGDQVLLFGGYDGAYNDETWVYDLSDNTWTLKSPATKPSARLVHRMASLGGDQVLLFGGADPFYDDETWVYDLSDNTWTLKSPATKPPAINMHAMASLGGDQVLLFGGDDGGGLPWEDDTWVYDLSDNTWTLKSPTTKPSGRRGLFMATLEGDQVLLFGGSEPASDDETWVYDLSDNTWTLKSPATKPSARTGQGMASLGGDQVLLFGGSDVAVNDETWVYDLSDNAWTLKSPTTKPSARHSNEMASLGGDQVLLFGGYDVAADDETWVYTATPASPATIEGVVSANANGLANVTVKLLDAGGLPVEGIDPVLTEAQGGYSFPNMASADYQVMIVEPLGYAVDVNPKAVSLAEGETETVNFSLTASVLSNTSRGKGYWKHQFDVYITGKGSAQETQAQLNSYIASVHTFYDPHFPVFAGTLTFANWQAILSSSKNASMLEKAKEHLAALVLNFASLKIGQYTAVTADYRTAGDVLTYVSTLVSDGNATNDELAKDLAEKVNSQLLIAGGVVPPSTILYKDPVEITGGAGVVPNTYSLSQNSPNPFNPSTKISFQLPDEGFVSLKVFDMLGREVATLVSEELSPGTYSVTWDASGIASGVYLYRLSTTNYVETRRLVLLR